MRIHDDPEDFDPEHPSCIAFVAVARASAAAYDHAFHEDMMPHRWQEYRRNENERYDQFIIRGKPARAMRVALGDGDGDVELDESLPAIAAVRAWCPSSVHGNILILHGKPGSGKTTALCYWTYEVARLHRPAPYATAVEYFNASRFGGARARWLQAEVLLFDDLGVEGGEVQTDFDELLDAFYSRPRSRLLIGSNLSPAAIAARYGERVTDRLHEAGHLVHVEGPSLRRRST